MKFSDKYIQSLKPTDKIQDIREGKGFGIRITPGGSKTWFFIYRIDGKRRFMNIGHYPSVTLTEANKRYRAAFNLYEQGKDPLAMADSEIDERRKAPTIEGLIKEYIEKHAKPTKRSWEEDQRILNKDALTIWGKRKAKDITKRDVVLLLENIIERGSPGSANNNFKIIRKMFRFAVQRDILEHSPCDGVVMPAPLNRGDRVLSESEIKTLWNKIATCHASDSIRNAIKLILVTAQRPGEVIGMHTDEIDGHWWTVPAERAKNKKAHRVYLTDTALGLIGHLKVVEQKTGKEKNRGYIFPCPKKPKIIDEKDPNEGIRPMGRLSISQVVGRNLSCPVLVNKKPVFDARGNPVTENKLGVADFTPHDLRRTAATFMSQIGIMDEVIDAVLNHAKQGIIRTYNLNRYDAEKQASLEAWERKLLSIVTESDAGKIIPITRKGA